MPLLDRTVALSLTWQVLAGLQQHAVAQQQLPRALPALAEEQAVSAKPGIAWLRPSRMACTHAQDMCRVAKAPAAQMHAATWPRLLGINTAFLPGQLSSQRVQHRLLGSGGPLIQQLQGSRGAEQQGMVC